MVVMVVVWSVKCGGDGGSVECQVLWVTGVWGNGLAVMYV